VSREREHAEGKKGGKSSLKLKPSRENDEESGSAEKIDSATEQREDKGINLRSRRNTTTRDLIKGSRIHFSERMGGKKAPGDEFPKKK